MKQTCLAILLGSFLAGWAQAETAEGRAAELKAAITNANQALILAVRSGDAEPLALHFSGEALAPLSLSIKQARAVKRYSVSELLDTTWGEIQAQDERAEVEVAEKWQHTLRSGDGQMPFQGRCSCRASNLPPGEDPGRMGHHRHRR